jgi:hypothetical protein
VRRGGVGIVGRARGPRPGLHGIRLGASAPAMRPGRGASERAWGLRERPRHALAAQRGAARRRAARSPLSGMPTVTLAGCSAAARSSASWSRLATAPPMLAPTRPGSGDGDGDGAGDGEGEGRVVLGDGEEVMLGAGESSVELSASGAGLGEAGGGAAGAGEGDLATGAGEGDLAGAAGGDGLATGGVGAGDATGAGAGDTFEAAAMTLAAAAAVIRLMPRRWRDGCVRGRAQGGRVGGDCVAEEGRGRAPASVATRAREDSTDLPRGGAPSAPGELSRTALAPRSCPLSWVARTCPAGASSTTSAGRKPSSASTSDASSRSARADALPGSPYSARACPATRAATIRPIIGRDPIGARIFALGVSRARGSRP